MILKRYLLFTSVALLGLILPQHIRAQQYSFDFGNIPYSEIEGNFLVLNQDFDDTLFVSVPIGFEFRFAGRSWTKVNISSNGELLFGNDTANFDTVRAIFPFFADLVSDYVNHTPAISYESGGCAGAVVMKIQYKECSFKGGSVDDFINFQVWLYESTGAIEFHYGPGHVGSASACFNGQTGPRVGTQELVSATGQSLFSFFLTGFPFGPDLSTSPVPVYLEGIPDAGQVYIFEPVSTMGLSNLEVRGKEPFLFKEPASGSYEVGLNNEQSTLVSISLIDASGKEIKQFFNGILEAGNQSVRIPVIGLPAGMWFVRITKGNRSSTLRFPII